ncbi:MAG: molybdopterin oxidoreductase family protein [Actinomycetales bacterium]
MTVTETAISDPAEQGTATHCPYCALQCAMGLTAPTGEDSPTLVSVTGRDFPTNRGGLCQKGWTSAEVLSAADRLRRPMLRNRSGRLVPAGWDAALDHVAEALLRIRAESGPDAIAVLGGGGLTHEKAYTLGKFARVAIGTRFIDYNGRFCMSSAAAATNRAFGLDRGLPFPLADLDQADAVLLLGTNVAETMPPFVQHLAGVRDRGGLVVVDPRHSPTAALTASGAGLHLQPVPGTDLALLQGLLHVLIAENLCDTDYLDDRVSGFEAAAAAVSVWWPERTEQVTGVSADLIRRVARMLAARSPRRGRGAVILTGRGVEQSAQGVPTVTAAINLALALGLPGRPNSGYGPITGQGNGQGGREHGQKCDQLPGYRSIGDPVARAHVAQVWGVDPDSLPGPGLPAMDLLARLGEPGGIRALLVHGSNLVVSVPNSEKLRRGLAGLDLMVVCDIVPSETAELADVVLPVAQWAEEEGTMTSLEGRIIRRRAALAPPHGVRTELDVLCDLATRLEAPCRFERDPAAVFDELARASAGGTADYSGVDYARLDAGQELFWPVPAAEPGTGAPHPGTPRVFIDGFATPDGRARMFPVEHTPPTDDVREQAPVYLLTGRVLQHYQSGAQTRRVPALVAGAGEPFGEIHPNLAARYGLQEGTPMRLQTARGDLVVRCRFSPAIRADCIFVPFHWSGSGSVNRVTSDACDPVSGMPELKVCAVRVLPDADLDPARAELVEALR